MINKQTCDEVAWRWRYNHRAMSLRVPVKTKVDQALLFGARTLILTLQALAHQGKLCFGSLKEERGIFVTRIWESRQHDIIGA